MSAAHAVTLKEIGAIADRYYENFPDVRTCARDWAIKLLKFHTDQNLDPDQVYWLDFDNAQNSPLTHTGQQHFGPPKQAISMTELVLRRFDMFYQVNFDLLDQMSGFYTTKDATRFDETNEVLLAPSSIMHEFWATDFSSYYNKRLDGFLQRCGRDGRLLLKVLFFAFSWRAYNAGSLSRNQLKTVINTVAGTTGMPPSVQNLDTEFTARKLATVHTFSLGDLSARDILRIKTQDQHEILYMAPGWFKVFHNEQEMYDWLRDTAADAYTRDRLLEHFANPDDPTVAPRSVLLPIMERIRTTPWRADQQLLNVNTQTLQGDVFTFLFEQVAMRLKQDARVLLQSNYELRKELFLVDLDALVRITAPLAPGDPAIALVTVAAGSLSFGSHLAKAVHGKDRASRQAGFRAAVLDAVTILLDVPLLKSTGDSALSEFADLGLGEELLATEVASVEPVPDSHPALRALAVDLDPEPFPQGVGIRRGVYQQDETHSYIRMAGQVYQVRYIELLERWVIVDPANPASLYGSWPVERNWRGKWEPFVMRVTAPVQQVLHTPTDPAHPLAKARRLSLQLRQLDVSKSYHDMAEILIGRDADNFMNAALDGVFSSARSELVNLRKALARQANEFFDAPPARDVPAVPVITRNMTPSRFLEEVYSDAYGLVLGDSRSGMAGRKFLIKYMAQLKQDGVDTLYIEGLANDLHQQLLDQYWNTNSMPRELEKQLKRMNNRSELLDLGRYTPYRVVTEARRQGIKLKALDCAASLSGQGLTDVPANTARRMRAYYAFKRIEAHQAGNPEGKWIALLDQTRACTFKGTPGLADLTGSVSLRVKDIDRGLVPRLSLDKGEVLKTEMAPIRANVLLEMGTLEALIDEETIF
ncbi:dermonecrotic toxin domain-containing protein [Pseudomonas sp. TE3610]